MLPESCGLSLLLALPDDVFVAVTQSLSPRDICNLSMCCRSLYTLMAFDKVWLSQCEMMGIVPLQDIVEWRKGVTSYKALCRFFFSVQPLIGIWVHQNPELGNVVCVMPGFVSVVGCRIIPQELGPLGIKDGPILWAPVFEIIGDFDGSASFCLHGREREMDYFYPGSFKPFDRTCNVLLLEVEPRKWKNAGKLTDSKSFSHYPDTPLLRKVSSSNSGISRSQTVFGRNESMVPFSRLTFGDRRKLLSTVMNGVRRKVTDSVHGPLFPRLRDDEENFQKDMVLLFERRSLLMQKNELGRAYIDRKASSAMPPHLTRLELSEIGKKLDRLKSRNADDGRTQCTKKKTLGTYFRDSLKQILGKSCSMNGDRAVSSNINFSSCSESDEQFDDFVRSGDTIGLTLRASTMKLSTYRAWPNMHDSRFALYKLPVQVPTADQEYPGLWGGTFGWPPGRPSEDKPGKALFFFLLSYEESQGKRFLIATKILEGTHYVMHPNGSAMFMVNMDEPSDDPFPWDSDADSLPIDVKQAFTGEGIASGYGFRYPGSKPGSLFVIQDDLLAFIWKESRAVLTLQKLNLQELLRKGEQILSLPPIANFSYLTRSYSNVFSSHLKTSTRSSSTRQNHI